MRLTLQEYQEQATRTLARLDSYRKDMFHMNSGIKTEQSELLDILKRHFAYGKAIDRVNFIEEVGDICWYASNKNFMHGVANDISYDPPFLSVLIAQKFTDLLSVAEFLEEIDLNKQQPNSILYCCKKLCDFMNFDFNECLYLNIAKLYKRYPEKFDESFALDRDLDGERTILENGIK